MTKSFKHLAQIFWIFFFKSWCKKAPNKYCFLFVTGKPQYNKVPMDWENMFINVWNQFVVVYETYFTSQFWDWSLDFFLLGSPKVTKDTCCVELYRKCSNASPRRASFSYRPSLTNVSSRAWVACGTLQNKSQQWAATTNTTQQLPNRSFLTKAK